MQANLKSRNHKGLRTQEINKKTLKLTEKKKILIIKFLDKQKKNITEKEEVVNWE